MTSIPVTKQYWLRRARVPTSLLHVSWQPETDGDGLTGIDIEIADGRIAALAPAGSAPIEAGIDLDDGQVWPVFVDVHTHLDIGHIWPRSPNLDGSVAGARAAALKDRGIRWPAGDVRRRFEFGLRCAFAHGVGAIRTHLNSNPVQAAEAWAAFRGLRDQWAGRIALQATSLVPISDFGTDDAITLADLVAESGGNLGAAMTLTGAEIAAAAHYQSWLDRLFELAEQRNLDIDLHVDEIGDTGARSLGHIARTALRRNFKGKILCGHCCSLSLQPDEVVDETLRLCREAAIAVVSLPMCNMYLQDRHGGRTPRWRGVTLLHEMKSRGIPVALASDDVRNAWYGFGDQDMLEVFTQGVRIAHLDQPYGDWPRAVTATPAAIMGLEAFGSVRVGATADLVLFRARSMSELLSRPQGDRIVLRAGRRIDTTLPDYRELDDLQGPGGPA